ncbi:hypothetical protein CDD81_7428 [Ophiocordyceps australis]|uniref:Uncharacterized protein n=1 Tax=Ophiocordyceps australis TaxID=1399860 RepID=A0A2C5YFI3_9HYPO|nr:hypothetical protein CDD81_7428 [Ophiocordyceps australis]
MQLPGRLTHSRHTPVISHTHPPPSCFPILAYSWLSQQQPEDSVFSATLAPQTPFLYTRRPIPPLSLIPPPSPCLLLLLARRPLKLESLLVWSASRSRQPPPALLLPLAPPTHIDWWPSWCICQVAVAVAPAPAHPQSHPQSHIASHRIAGLRFAAPRTAAPAPRIASSAAASGACRTISSKHLGNTSLAQQARDCI